MEMSVSRGVFLTLFSKTEIKSFENGVATIACGNPYVSSMLEERYYSLIASSLSKQLKFDKVSLIFVATGKTERKKEPESEMGPLFEQKNEQRTEVPLVSTNLRPDFNFESFAVSGSNQLAYAAAEAVAATPGKAYNPFFIWGGVGVGKTHLMQAAGWAILHKNPSLKVIYCAGEDFTNEIVEAIRQKKTSSFKNRYRSADVLLIDDVQFIAGKDTVQEEFFHTFNTIHRSGGQIMLTSDKPPSEIAKLEDRLRSRFEGGMTVDISPPDFELRTAILLIKSKARGKELPIETAKVLAENINDTRRLEGTLTKLMAVAQMQNRELSAAFARELLGEAPKEKNNKVSPQEMLEAVCEYFDLKPSQIKGDKRDRPIALPRQILMYLLKTELSLPHEEIGGFLGGRDHTTIMHGVEKIKKMVLESERTREDIRRVKEKATSR